MDESPKPNFDLSCEVSVPHYFKSSFARSMAVDCMKQSKSLDNAFLDRPVLSENSGHRSFKSESVWTNASVNRGCRGMTESTPVCSGSKVQQNESDFARVINLRKNNRGRSQSIDAVKLWKINPILDTTNEETKENDENTPGQKQNSNSSYTESDVLRLRKECQSLVEENRRLQAALNRRSPPGHGQNLHAIDSAILQSQVDTLQWQLKQTESSRQMYRALMEQVVRFLERAYKSLDLLKNKTEPGGRRAKPSPSRFPRSRSVHTVDVSPSRAASPVPDSSHVPRAKSITQIEDTPTYSTFRDFTWRRPRQCETDPGEIPPGKLSQEAFRLLRTVQSLLNTREPDLAQRLCTNLDPEIVPDLDSSGSLASSLPGHDEEPVQCNSSQKREPISFTSNSCNSLLRQSLEASSLRSINYNNNNSSLTSGLESAFAGGCRTTSPPFTSSLSRPRKCNTPSPPVTDSSYPPRSSPPVSTTEDESGFSSMNSFQEVGIPLLVSPSPTPSFSLSSDLLKQNSHYSETHFPAHKIGNSESCKQTSPYSETHFPSHILTDADNSKQSCQYSETHFPAHTEGSSLQSLSYSTSGFQEVGLPIVEHPPSSKSRGMTPNHRRWSSSPADALTQYSKHNASFCGTGETLKVLWV